MATEPKGARKNLHERHENIKILDYQVYGRVLFYFSPLSLSLDCSFAHICRKFDIKNLASRYQ